MKEAVSVAEAGDVSKARRVTKADGVEYVGGKASGTYMVKGGQ